MAPNYWEVPQPNGYKGPLPNPNAPRMPPPGVNAPAPPPEDDLSRLVKEVVAQNANNPGVYPWSKPVDPIELMNASSNYIPGTDTVKPDPRPDLLSAVNQGPAYDPSVQIGSPVGGYLGGIVDSINSYARSIADEANAAEANDPAAILAKLRQQYGSYSYDGPSANQMVSREFDPQFAALDKMAGATEGRYTKNAQNLAGLYGAYAKDVLSGRDATAQNYKQGTQAINDTYTGAENNVTKNMSGLTSEMTDQLALLGQGQAAPAVMQKKQELLNQQLGSLAQAQGTAAAQNTQLGSNAYAYDTRQSGIAQQAGLNAQQDLSSQLEDKMAGYDAQRLGLEGNKGQALNSYDMMIRKMIQEGNSGIGQQVDDAFKAILGQQSNSADREIQQARLNLDLQKYQDSQNNPKAPDTSKMNPYDALVQRAQGAYGDPQQASNASDILYQTGMMDPNAPNIKALMDMLEENNPGWSKDPQNRALAYDYFSRILSANKK